MLLSRANSEETLNLVDRSGADCPTAAYLHIPFCRRRCFYCDFAVSVVGDKLPIARNDGVSEPLTGSNSGTIAHYIERLCQEIRATTTFGKPLQTVFLGGGTPSLLAVEQLKRILITLEQQFGIATEAEIAMEIDPGTFDLVQVKGYRSAGINRVSLGVQAFQPELLQACGRSHTVADIHQSVEWVQQAGFENFSLDLISGLPHQTLEDWQASLEMAIALKPTHLSCYDLTIEPVTAFGRQYKPGAQPLPSDETTAEMYRMAQRLLTTAGYDHYEISNYAKPGYQCRHNRVYWENRSFYGFGMGATSYLEHNRFSRPRKTREYYAWVEGRQEAEGRGQRAGEAGEAREVREAGEATPTSRHPIPYPPHPTPDILDTLMLGLRLAEGLSIAALIEQFGYSLWERVWMCLQPFCANGWVMSEPADRPNGSSTDIPISGRLRLTDPEGFLFSNVILIALFEALDL
ncbi:MAG: radical SAM family heme chaperone HemW [Stenomitos rutilans HA7619-LM2]|jgi:oxygen-independent coproporphyrinogen-3 oxidase|nr:radical SAM family heme chaperone HemW [Stenomitos rutilans HA7619-LM2]